MTTIQHHRPAALHLWWYVAAAVAAGAVLAVLFTVLHTSAGGTIAPTSVNRPLVVHHYAPNQHLCFAGRPSDNPELIRSGC